MATTDPYPSAENLSALGAPDDAKESDPDAVTATIVSLLRGILEELQAHTVLLTSIETNTGV